METVGILSLPNELLCDISRYLSMNDIQSCSMSCHRLRSALNNDLTWKRFLHLKDLTYFEEKELPTVDIPLQETLSPLCTNRLHVMRYLKILNNWTHGRCSYEVIQEDYGNKKKREKRFKPYMSMYCDSFVFLVAEFEKCYVELWDIRGKPMRLTYIKYQSVNNVLVVGDNLLIFYSFRIYVHDICIKDNALPFKYVIHTNDEDLSLTSLGNEDRSNNKVIQFTSFWRHDVYKQFLISTCKKKVFIWDIEKSKKVIIYNFPHACSNFLEVNSSYGSYVLLRSYSLYGDHAKVINIYQNECLELIQLNNADQVVLQDSYFVTFKSIPFEDSLFVNLTCSVYNIKTQHIMSQRSFTVHRYFNVVVHTRIVNGCFALPCQDSTLKLMDAKTLEIIHTMECKQKLGFMVINQFNVLTQLFVSAIDSFNFNIWNVEKKVLLPKLDFLNNVQSIIRFNKWCSKVVSYDVQKKIIVILNFLK